MTADKASHAEMDLWERGERVAARALEQGALKPITTQLERVRDGLVEFQVRIVSSLREKDQLTRPASFSQPSPMTASTNSGLTPPARRNPFLPYDEPLFVAPLSPDHVCLLNKFPVMPRHLLIVTTRYESQETKLDERHFAALAMAMQSTDCLGFYNSGAAAGASQPHRHLQVLPLPLSATGDAVPIDPLLRTDSSSTAHRAVQKARLPFDHGFIRFDNAARRRPAERTKQTLQAYDLLLKDLQLAPDPSGHLPPYNLLVTHAWMLMIPRTRESWNSISINALGFAGSFFLRDRTQLDELSRAGPLRVLESVARNA